MTKVVAQGSIFKAKSQFFTIWTDPKPANNMFIFFPVENWLSNGFIHPFVKNLRSEQVSNSDTRLRKMY